MINEKWEPANLPTVKQDFNPKPAEKSHTQIATKGELDSLIAERRNPVRNLDYTPDSQAKTKLQDRVINLREERITDIETLFSKNKAKVRDDFNINADDYLHKKTEQEKSR